jgi:hypothetical protein
VRVSNESVIMSGTVSKQDQTIHEQALVALAHHYRHGDNGPFNKLIATMPKSNRKEALLLWIKTFTTAVWDRNRQVFLKGTKLPDQNLDAATVTPFWTLKEKQVQRRHVSGNAFEPDLFFDRVITDIQTNIKFVTTYKLEKVIEELQRILATKTS